MIGVAIAVLLMVFVLGYGVAVFNRLVKQRNSLADAWAGIDVQLTRRADLVPNLVEVVKGYKLHEQQTLEEVTAARTNVPVKRSRCQPPRTFCAAVASM